MEGRNPTQMSKLRLLLADDHEDLLREITALVEREFEVIGVAHNGNALVEAAAELSPDVVITDFKMPGLSGIDATRKLLSQGTCKAVVLLSNYADNQLVDRAFEAGIQGFVLKVKAGEDLIPAIRSAFQGVAFVSSFHASSV
jgi:DNA-binding NarL/FixJ family response regulator